MKLFVVAMLSLIPIVVAAQQGAPGRVPAGLAPGPHQIVVNDTRLWYAVAGTGGPGTPPVVFLHGGPGQGSYHFAALAGPYLERTLRMVYFDQRGSGRSERPWTGEYSMATLVEDIEGLRRELGVPQIALVGHSFGGTLALEYAAKYPGQVSRLVFVSGLYNAPLQGKYRCQNIRTRYPALARAADSVATGPDEQCDWFWKLPSAQREGINNTLMFPDSLVRKRLDSTVTASGLRNTGELSGALFRAGLLQYRFTRHAQLTMPVLVIVGRHDAAVTVEGVRELTDHLPQVTVREYENSGHFVYLDEPERFARDVTTFVTGANARP